jgi:hypothetical protein
MNSYVVWLQSKALEFRARSLDCIYSEIAENYRASAEGIVKAVEYYKSGDHEMSARLFLNAQGLFDRSALIEESYRVINLGKSLNEKAINLRHRLRIALSDAKSN